MVNDSPVASSENSESIETDDIALPEEYVRDEADREMLLQMTELEREMEIAERAERHRREMERISMLEISKKTDGKEGDTFLGKRKVDMRLDLDDSSSDEDLMFASQTSTPTATQKKRDEELSERSSDESDTEDREAADNEAEFSDYLSAQIFRSDLERWISEPHFEYSVLRCFVRFHGNEAKIEKSRNEYSMMEVIDCQNKEDVQPYKQLSVRFGHSNKTTKVQLLLKKGSIEFWTNLDVLSNSPFTMREFEEWVQACKRHKRYLPSKSELEALKGQIEQARKFVFTHEEVKKILDGKRKSGSLKVSNVMQRAHLMRYRDYYYDRHDTEKVKEYDAMIKELEAKADAQRRSKLQAVDKQAVARDKQVKAESLEALADRRRPRVLEKFERKLARLPPSRRSKAMIEFYGPSHPRCAHLQETDVQHFRSSLEKSPSPDTEPDLPEGILLEPDLERDFKDPFYFRHSKRSLAECLTTFAEDVSKRDANLALCHQILDTWDVADPWDQEIREKIAKGDVGVKPWPK